MLIVSPNAPQYTPSGNYLKTKRAGSIMLSWAKATNNGFDYSKKSFFALSPSEVGLTLEVLDSKLPEVTMTHSPNMNADDQTKKVLKIVNSQTSDGHPMLLFKYTGETQVAASLNAGEARALRELLVYSLPRLYGFHSVLEGPLNVDDGGSGNSFGNSTGSRAPRRTGGAAGSNSNAGDWPF
ncbi:TPA: hypothetical protein N0F65_006081 [Lagenidium giganteum]|uniref:Uncharacterized protein n=1 Tax=Lagenidium giganteum TaxID=4803 RepID=A0AAV2YNC7_9STRA|nr:TPA: hypothetical protein N0F65_006081 [Lagenidium giganteum]